MSQSVITYSRLNRFNRNILPIRATSDYSQPLIFTRRRLHTLSPEQGESAGRQGAGPDVGPVVLGDAEAERMALVSLVSSQHSWPQQMALDVKLL